MRFLTDLGVMARFTTAIISIGVFLLPVVAGGLSEGRKGEGEGEKEGDKNRNRPKRTKIREG